MLCQFYGDANTIAERQPLCAFSLRSSTPRGLLIDWFELARYSVRHPLGREYACRNCYSELNSVMRIRHGLCCDDVDLRRINHKYWIKEILSNEFVSHGFGMSPSSGRQVTNEEDPLGW
jgi:hypothetical protein